MRLLVVGIGGGGDVGAAAVPTEASAARLAEAVRGAGGLRHANAILTRMGVGTELGYEQRMAR